MKIEKIDENQVKITLSCAEMLKMNADSASEEASTMMRELLGALEQEFSFSMLNHAIMLEMLPSKKGGCEIFLTRTESNKRNPNDENLLVSSFSESNDALYAGMLSKRYGAGCIRVYLMQGEYYLVIDSNSPSLAKLKLLLCEFGNTVENPHLMESILKEYGTLITEEDSPPLLM